jgi:hypothetical protein
MAASMVNPGHEYLDIQIPAQSKIIKRMAHGDNSRYDSMKSKRSA